MDYGCKNISNRGGRHRGVIENVERDMFDNTILYLVRSRGLVIPVRAEALEDIGTRKKKRSHDTEAEEAQP